MFFYQKSIEAVLYEFGIDLHIGVTKMQFQEKQSIFGPNKIFDLKQKTVVSIFVSQFQNALIYVLLIAAVMIFFTSEKIIDAFIVTGILLFNAVLGTVQEYRAQNIIESLRQYIKTETLVLRDGEKIIILEADLVPGDIIFLHEGERVPADARIIDCIAVSVDESVLTGESEPVYKNAEIIKEIVPIYAQKNMLFQGTTILTGRVTAIVIYIGKQTEFGKLQKSINEIKTETPLKKSLDQLSIVILVSIAILCCILFLIGLASGRAAHSIFSVLIALFICIIPEGLPLVLTLVLVSGARKLAKNEILVRNMQAVETLGHVDVIVIDKTGTITKNELMVSSIFADKKEYAVTGDGYKAVGYFFEKDQQVELIDEKSALYKTGIITRLISDAQVIHNKTDGTCAIRGNPTEAALLVCGQKMNISNDIIILYKKISEIPFRPEIQFHAALYSIQGIYEIYIVGSPEAVFSRCFNVTAFFDTALQVILSSGSRAIAIAIKKVSVEDQLEKSIDFGFEMLSLIGINDVVRSNVKEIVQQARQAGIQVIMATGDHAVTAKIIAQSVGILKENDNCLDGSVFATMTPEHIEKCIGDTTLFSRMLPEYKMQIVDALRKKNKIVAMTGDGINDAPALVFADVGIAMGSGTDIAKEAADIVLLDDSFEYIIKGIILGKHIFFTLKRVVLYFFSTNLSELCIIFFAFLIEAFFRVHFPIPITAAQILWLNLVTDGFLDVGISMEKEEENLLDFQIKGTRLLDKPILLIGVYSSIYMGTISLLFFYLNYQNDIKIAQTLTLVTMAMFQWFNAWNCRSINKSIFLLGFFSNKPLILTTIFVFVLQFCVIYLPGLQYLFDTTSISLSHWITIIFVSSTIIVCEEIRKYFMYIRSGYK